MLSARTRLPSATRGEWSWGGPVRASSRPFSRGLSWQEPSSAALSLRGPSLPGPSWLLSSPALSWRPSLPEPALLLSLPPSLRLSLPSKFSSSRREFPKTDSSSYTARLPRARELRLGLAPARDGPHALARRPSAHGPQPRVLVVFGG